MGLDFATGYFTCPRCGNGVFRCYPQTIALNRKQQTIEYTCTKCNNVTAMVQEDWRAESADDQREEER